MGRPDKYKDWFENFRNGKDDAMADLISEQYAKIYLYAKKILEGTEEEAKLVSTAAIQLLWERHAEINDYAHAVEYLFSAVQNHSFELLRNKHHSVFKIIRAIKVTSGINILRIYVDALYEIYKEQIV